MIARPLESYADLRPSTGTRSGRGAALVRRRRTRRSRYAGFLVVFAMVAIPTIVIVTYLALMANVTRMNYELSKNARTKSALVDESSRLEDRIARLETRERLAALASGLGMREPQAFAQVAMPVEHAPVAHGIAFLTWLK